MARARSSAGEHYVDIVGVTGSIPVAPTIYCKGLGPRLGLVHGQWDLRGYLDQYLGQVSFSGRRVLEIAPASGFLTIEMEKGAQASFAIEIPDEAGWDFIPYPTSVMEPVYALTRAAPSPVQHRRSRSNRYGCRVPGAVASDKPEHRHGRAGRRTRTTA
jgi:hypothetical protein